MESILVGIFAVSLFLVCYCKTWLPLGLFALPYEKEEKIDTTGKWLITQMRAGQVALVILPS